MYIWVEAIQIQTDDQLAGISPFVQLRWIISSGLGDYSDGGLYCDIEDINADLVDSQNFNLSCIWRPIDYESMLLNNTTKMTTGNTIPYQCLNPFNDIQPECLVTIYILALRYHHLILIVNNNMTVHSFLRFIISDLQYYKLCGNIL